MLNLFMACAMVRCMGSQTDALFEALANLKARWPKGGWSWDYRFSTVTSSFHVDTSSEAEQALAGLLPNEYNYRSIANAPPVVRDVVEAAGGVRTDQRVFATPQNGRLLAYGLWWPWGDEITISLRVGLGGYVGDADQQRLQELFNALS
jgi:hypothetical protein